VVVARAPLVVAAIVSIVAAVVLDVRAQEHPTHTAVLGVVALGAAVVRRRMAGRFNGVFSAVCGALAAQPALHAASAWETLGSGVSFYGHFHEVLADAPMTASQVMVPIVAIIVGSLCSRIFDFFARIVRTPLRLVTSGSLGLAFEGSVNVRATPHGSMLHWCGWTIRKARRGPPTYALL
jgi:hypothetical protein